MAQDSTTVKRIVLVYQVGIANVFEVDRFSRHAGRRNGRRLLQSDYHSCAMFARGMGATGYVVRTMNCDMAGDCARFTWEPGKGELWADTRRKVHCN
jgi:hypothetical protein